MPELPEVETVRRGLITVWEGRRFARVEARRPDLRIPLPPDFAARLTGRRVLRLDRRAKYLLGHLDDGTVLILHLGMSGRMTIVGHNRPPLDPHDHLVFETDEGTEVRFRDPRRFGLATLVPAGDLGSFPMLAALGPEPLGEDFTAASLAAGLASRRASPIKAALLDQGMIAGLGNIYVCEALFRAGISPTRPAASVGGPKLSKLVAAIKAVLEEAIAAGGSTLRDHALPSGELGYFQHRFAVYGREGENCGGCVSEIRRIVQSGRSTFYCARCQR